MKTLKRVFLFTAVVSLLISCSKTYSDEDFSGIDLKAKNGTPEVIVVTPNGVDDTESLADAFAEAMSHGPGNVVQLVEGEYFLGLIEIRDFYGSLRGAGKDKTIITAIGGIDRDAIFAQHHFDDLVKFVGGDVHLSQFTLQTPPGALSFGGLGYGNIYSLLNLSSFNALYEPGNETRSIIAVIDNVRFKGQLLEGGPGYVLEYNCFMAVRTGLDFFAWPGDPLPRQKIDFKITNSEFDTFVYGLALEGMENSLAIVGEKNKGNIFSNLDQAGGVFECRNMNVLVEGNIFNVPALSYGWDVADYQYDTPLEDVPETETSLCNIQFNVFNLAHSEYALYLYNERQFLYGEKPVAFQVKNNQFNMSDVYDYGIWTVATNGMVIRNNKFSGLGGLALYLVTFSEGGLVLGNNFSTAEFGTAAIYLNPSTKDWTVVGGNIMDQVINMGTNNIITGMNVSTSDIPLGRTIHEKLPPMNHLMH